MELFNKKEVRVVLLVITTLCALWCVINMFLNIYVTNEVSKYIFGICGIIDVLAFPFNVRELVRK